MTWIAAFKFLRAYWKFIAVVLLICGVFWLHFDAVSDAREEGARLERAKFDAEIQTELAREREHQREVNDEIDRLSYEREAELTSRVNRLLARSDGPIRMCESADQVRGPSGPGGAPEAAAGGGSTLRAGEDLRTQLVLYGQRCEELRQQVISFQHWAAF